MHHCEVLSPHLTNEETEAQRGEVPKVVQLGSGRAGIQTHALLAGLLPHLSPTLGPCREA